MTALGEFIGTVVSESTPLRRKFLERIVALDAEDVIDGLDGIGAALGEHDGNLVMLVVERVLALSVEQRRAIFNGRS